MYHQGHHMPVIETRTVLIPEIDGIAAVIESETRTVTLDSGDHNSLSGHRHAGPWMDRTQQLKDRLHRSRHYESNEASFFTSPNNHVLRS